MLGQYWKRGRGVEEEEALKEEYHFPLPLCKLARNNRTTDPPSKPFPHRFSPVGVVGRRRSGVSFVASRLNIGLLSLSLASDAVFILRGLKLNVKKKEKRPAVTQFGWRRNMAANCIKPNGWWRRGPHYSPAISAGDSPFPSPPSSRCGSAARASTPADYLRRAASAIHPGRRTPARLCADTSRGRNYITAEPLACCRWQGRAPLSL